MTTMSAFELHGIVEYIRSVGVDFDACDIDEDFPGVLAQYGVVVETAEDLEALRRELLPLGLQRELSEMARLDHEQAVALDVFAQMGREEVDE